MACFNQRRSCSLAPSQPVSAMWEVSRWAVLCVASSLLVPVFSARSVRGDDEVDFVKQIQPIFKSRCVECHDVEKREGGLRLDRRGPALAGGDSGQVILPGKSGESKLIKLVSGDDPDRVMPPDGDNLTADEITLLKRWIDAGAEWPEGADGPEERPTHWSYQPLRKPVPGETIDSLVREGLKKRGVDLAPEADRVTLIRRLSLDLIGLPPSPEEVDAFLQDQSPDAYERVVDRLLASPHFGERWGRHWLDMARYADSDGYEKDRPRFNAWKYRDWVIQAINDDLPFDQFTIEQLAGDLLRNATPSQVLATGFHRQTLTNTEGGTDQEQWRVEAVFDRVETTGAVWLGLTVGCARCHSHKYDAISQREYYQLFAYFNNGDETNLNVPTDAAMFDDYRQKKSQWDQQLAEWSGPLNDARERLRPGFTTWLDAERQKLQHQKENADTSHVLAEASVTSEQGVTYASQKDGSFLAQGKRPATDITTVSSPFPTEFARRTDHPIAGIRLDLISDKRLPSGGPGWADNGNFVLSEITLDVITDAKAPNANASTVSFKFGSAQADFSQSKFDVAQAIDGKTDEAGWAISPQIGKDHSATFLLDEKSTQQLQEFVQSVSENRPADQEAVLPRLEIRLVQQYATAGGSPHPLGRFRVSLIAGPPPETSTLPETIQKLLAISKEKLTKPQQQELFEHFTSTAPEVRELLAKIDNHRKQEPFKPELMVPVMSERKTARRVTRVMSRGDFQQPLGEVAPGTLEVLHSRTSQNPEPGRLDLAEWLVDPQNPLTPRVTVNHVWKHLFGQGLVRTINDFGVRGERPEYPELLDWLAAEFIRNGWSRKQLIKTVLMSQTYRQKSDVRPELAELDPTNLWLARQNRVRVEAEIVRDLWLAASGLLERRIGGPSVFPPLPPGIAELSYASNFKWGASDWNSRPDKPHGVSPSDDIYRRGMYTFFKRTAAHPTLMLFDCPDSNTTCVDRSLSNTPLQALATLNNIVFLDASRKLAERVLEQSPADDDTRLHGILRLCLARTATPAELKELRSLLTDARSYYESHPDDAQQLVTVTSPKGKPVDNSRFNLPELASWLTVCRVVMNLDEFVTRE
ncbi:MAG: PSD1 and planctomycete cytochrome C domain-containing protein [Planctomycetaceae bacterium]